MMQLLKYIDSLVTNAVNAILPHNSFFDALFSFFSLQGNAFPIWICMFLLLFIFEEKRDKRFVIYFLSSFILTVLIVNFGLKNFFERPRPFIAMHQVAGACPTDFGFPSGHASSAFAAAVIFAHFDKKRRWGYYLVAFLISLSRIYLHCHYFLDVLAGGLIGAGISYLILHIDKRVSHNTASSRISTKRH